MDHQELKRHSTPLQGTTLRYHEMETVLGNRGRLFAVIWYVEGAIQPRKNPTVIEITTNGTLENIKAQAGLPRIHHIEWYVQTLMQQRDHLVARRRNLDKASVAEHRSLMLVRKMAYDLEIRRINRLLNPPWWSLDRWLRTPGKS